MPGAGPGLPRARGEDRATGAGSRGAPVTAGRDRAALPSAAALRPPSGRSSEAAGRARRGSRAALRQGVRGPGPGTCPPFPGDHDAEQRSRSTNTTLMGGSSPPGAVRIRSVVRSRTVRSHAPPRLGASRPPRPALPDPGPPPDPAFTAPRRRRRPGRADRALAGGQRGDALEARTTSSGWSTTLRWRWTPRSSSASSSSSSAAIRPMVTAGCRTEVSGTAAAAANSMSS